MSSHSKKQESPSLVKFGRLSEPRGLKGEIYVHLLSGEAESFLKLKNVSLSKDGKTFSELQVSGTSLHNGKLFLSFKNVLDRTAVEKLRGNDLWIDESFFRSKPGDTIFLREVLGFEVYDGEKLIGVVEAFEPNPSQDILIVKLVSDGHQALVPLVKDYLIKIDFDKKQILMKLPEGLLEINRAL